VPRPYRFLLLPLQRTGTFPSLYLIIKGGLFSSSNTFLDEFTLPLILIILHNCYIPVHLFSVGAVDEEEGGHACTAASPANRYSRRGRIYRARCWRHTRSLRLFREIHRIRRCRSTIRPAPPLSCGGASWPDDVAATSQAGDIGCGAPVSPDSHH
jgi:hypothetical protein